MAGIYRRGKVYHARAQRNGVEHRRTLETADRRVAERRFKQWLADLEASAWGERPRIAFREAVKQTIDPAVIEKAQQRGYDLGYKEGRAIGMKEGSHAQLRRVVEAIGNAAMVNGDIDAMTAFKLPKIQFDEIPQSALVRLARPPAPIGNGTTVGTQSSARPNSQAGTPEGYCVESMYESGSVQIYPAAALRRMKP